MGYFFWRQVLTIINHKLKTQKMKKVLFVFAIAAAFVACNDSATTTETKTDSTVVKTDSVPAMVDTTAKVDTTVVKVDTTVKKDSTKK